MWHTFSKAGRWLDEYLLFALACLLIVFVPLYPKIPLWSPIEQYIVRVRLEDFVILGASLVWLVQALRRKITWNVGFFWWVVAYAIVGAASTVSAVYVTQTVPLQPLHLGKTILHYFRYLEYFTLFFITFSSIKNRWQLKFILGLLAVTVVAIAAYGYGQKYYYWPVYSTMNREFSKGIRLYLTQYARVQSTFAGHYDMAAYMVAVLPLILALALKTAHTWAKRGLWLTFWLGSWLLILSASRMPFAAYLGGVGLVVLITALLQTNWSQRIRFALSRGTLTLLGILVLFYYFGADLSERLGHVVNANPTLASAAAQLTDWRRVVLSDEQVASLPLSPERLQEMLPKTDKQPANGVSTDQVAAQIAAELAATQEVASSKDQPPTPTGDNGSKPLVSAPPIFKAPAPTHLPAGVYENIPDLVEVTTVDEQGEKVVKKVQRPRVYSECALEKELSLCIRLETLWPRALEGFLYNPFLGTGYATLTKEGIEIFTEADSTDNNYLRTLGETGAIGFIVFYGAIVYLLVKSFRRIKDADWLVSSVAVGFIGGSIGLLLNAIYIDVFAASKVAQTYWSLAGLAMAALYITRRQKDEKLATLSPVQPGDAESVTLAQAIKTASATKSKAGKRSRGAKTKPRTRRTRQS